MPDLRDGESLEMQGSGSRPYILQNRGGVYSCSCPAWRNQSTAIERRTCKHLRKLRGDPAEATRIGGSLPTPLREAKEAVQAPPLLLAERWDGVLDPTGWWLSEKLDGVRAYWDGQQFWSRLGNVYHAPHWFVAGLPTMPLDGELWLGRKQFQRTVAIVRRQDASDLWKEVRFVAFDAPALEKEFEARLAFVRDCLGGKQHPYAQAHEHQRCLNLDHLRTELERLETLGAEGLMLRQPGSRYENGRSMTLLKVKRFHDAEARVLKHLEGAGRHKGRLGALLVELPDGTTFSVGTGFSDAERERPPALGSLITFRYQELSDGGVPRFPSFVGVRVDGPQPSVTRKEKKPQASAPVRTTRRFEYSEGGSDKFWEIAVRETEVTIRFGRTGTQGQSQTNSFADATAATAHSEKLIREKTSKGYREVA